MCSFQWTRCLMCVWIPSQRVFDRTTGVTAKKWELDHCGRYQVTDNTTTTAPPQQHHHNNTTTTTPPQLLPKPETFNFTRSETDAVDLQTQLYQLMRLKSTCVGSQHITSELPVCLCCGCTLQPNKCCILYVPLSRYLFWLDCSRSHLL